MNKQVKRVSDCAVERLAQCRGEGSPTGVQMYHVCDTGLAEGTALGRISVVLVADFDRVRGERDALQVLLNAADQRGDDLQTDLTKAQALVKTIRNVHPSYARDRIDEYFAAHQSAPAAEVCQFPQSCSTMCDCKPDAAAAVDRSNPQHICPGCGSKGWQAHCEQCIPF